MSRSYSSIQQRLRSLTKEIDNTLLGSTAHAFSRRHELQIDDRESVMESTENFRDQDCRVPPQTTRSRRATGGLLIEADESALGLTEVNKAEASGQRLDSRRLPSLDISGVPDAGSLLAASNSSAGPTEPDADNDTSQSLTMALQRQINDLKNELNKRQVEEPPYRYRQPQDGSQESVSSEFVPEGERGQGARGGELAAASRTASHSSALGGSRPISRGSSHSRVAHHRGAHPTNEQIVEAEAGERALSFPTNTAGLLLPTETFNASPSIVDEHLRTSLRRERLEEERSLAQLRLTREKIEKEIDDAMRVKAAVVAASVGGEASLVRTDVGTASSSRYPSDNGFLKEHSPSIFLVASPQRRRRGEGNRERYVAEVPRESAASAYTTPTRHREDSAYHRYQLEEGLDTVDVHLPNNSPNAVGRSPSHARSPPLISPKRSVERPYANNKHILDDNGYERRDGNSTQTAPTRAAAGQTEFGRMIGRDPEGTAVFTPSSFDYRYLGESPEKGFRSPAFSRAAKVLEEVKAKVFERARSSSLPTNSLDERQSDLQGRDGRTISPDPLHSVPVPRLPPPPPPSLPPAVHFVPPSDAVTLCDVPILVIPSEDGPTVNAKLVVYGCSVKQESISKGPNHRFTGTVARAHATGMGHGPFAERIVVIAPTSSGILPLVLEDKKNPQIRLVMPFASLGGRLAAQEIGSPKEVYSSTTTTTSPHFPPLQNKKRSDCSVLIGSLGRRALIHQGCSSFTTKVARRHLRVYCLWIDGSDGQELMCIWQFSTLRDAVLAVRSVVCGAVEDNYSHPKPPQAVLTRGRLLWLFAISILLSTRKGLEAMAIAREVLRNERAERKREEELRQRQQAEERLAQLRHRAAEQREQEEKEERTRRRASRKDAISGAAYDVSARDSARSYPASRVDTQNNRFHHDPSASFDGDYKSRTYSLNGQAFSVTSVSPMAEARKDFNRSPPNERFLSSAPASAPVSPRSTNVHQQISKDGKKFVRVVKRTRVSTPKSSVGDDDILKGSESGGSFYYYPSSALNTPSSHYPLPLPSSRSESAVGSTSGRQLQMVSNNKRVGAHNHSRSPLGGVHASNPIAHASVPLPPSSRPPALKPSTRPPLGPREQEERYGGRGATPRSIVAVEGPPAAYTGYGFGSTYPLPRADVSPPRTRLLPPPEVSIAHHRRDPSQSKGDAGDYYSHESMPKQPVGTPRLFPADEKVRDGKGRAVAPKRIVVTRVRTLSGGSAFSSLKSPQQNALSGHQRSVSSLSGGNARAADYYSERD